jgi:O-acetyl-ADP-ribose deacetylase (regulator of RNase III)
MIKYVSGDIFESQCQTLVNPVNTVGVMGAGLARQFAQKYPDMLARYKALCQRCLLHIGTLWTWKSPERWILCFPTKKHWADPAWLSYIDAGLANLSHSYEKRGITSIAFPKIGCGLGGLDWELVEALIWEYLSPTTLDVEIYARGSGAPAEPELEWLRW